MSYSGEVLLDRPDAYYRMGEASGLIQDSSGNGNHATVANSTGAIDYRRVGPILSDLDNFAIELNAPDNEYFSIPAPNIAYDRFNRADGSLNGATSESGHTWRAPIHLETNDISIVSNIASLASPSASGFIVKDPGANARARLTLNTVGGSGSEIQIVARADYTAASNTYGTKPFYAFRMKANAAGDSVVLTRHSDIGGAFAGRDISVASGDNTAVDFHINDRMEMILQEIGGSTVVTALYCPAASGAYRQLCTWIDSDSSRPLVGSYGIYGEVSTWGCDNFYVKPYSSVNLGDYFTIEMWVKRQTLRPGAEDWVISKYNAYTLGFFDDHIHVAIPGIASIFNTQAAMTDLVSWHHIVATKNVDVPHIYLDGVDMPLTISGGEMIDTNYNLLIGGEEPGNILNYDGFVDEVALYSYPLSPNRIFAHRAAALSTITPKISTPMSGGRTW